MIASQCLNRMLNSTNDAIIRSTWKSEYFFFMACSIEEREADASLPAERYKVYWHRTTKASRIAAGAHCPLGPLMIAKRIKLATS